MGHHRHAQQLARQHRGAVAQRLVVDVDQVGPEAQHDPQRLQKRGRKVDQVVQPRQHLVQQPAQRGQPVGPGARRQPALHRHHVEPAVGHVAPARLFCDRLVLGVAQAGDHQWLEAAAVEIAHKVAQADDGAAVADAVLHVQHAPLAAQHAGVDGLVLVGHDADRVAGERDTPRLGAQRRTVGGQAAPHLRGQRVDVVGGVGVAGLAFDDELAAAAGACRHAGQAAGHGLEHDVG